MTREFASHIKMIFPTAAILAVASLCSVCLAQAVPPSETPIVLLEKPLSPVSKAGSEAARSMPEAKFDLVLEIGKSYTLAGNDIYRMAIGDSSILDVKPVSSSAVEVIAKSPGISSVYLWDKDGLREVKVKVLRSRAEMEELAARMNREIGLNTVSARLINGVLALDGVVGSDDDLNRAKTIANALNPETVNLVRVDPSAIPATLETMRAALGSANVTVEKLPDGSFLVQGSVANAQETERISAILSPWKKQNIRISESIYVASRPVKQVLIRARVVEINRRDLQNLGVDWGKVVFSSAEGGGATYTAEDQPWVVGQPRSGPFSIFGGPALKRLDPIGARINALIQENKGRILSEPNILVAEGNEASILVGGEIPVPIVQGGGGTSSVTIEWKQFGVNLKVTPSVGEDGKTLFLKLLPEVSSLDYGNAIVISGFTLPALRTRRVETSVQIEDGDSLIIGGLLQRDVAKNVKRIPLLSDIPILGTFFRTTNDTKSETELIIVITPEILKRGAGAG